MDALSIIAAAQTLVAVMREGGKLAELFTKLAKGQNVTVQELEQAIASRKASDTTLHAKLRTRAGK